MTEKTKVLIVDDHPMVAEGIQSILESYDDVAVVDGACPSPPLCGGGGGGGGGSRQSGNVPLAPAAQDLQSAANGAGHSLQSGPPHGGVQFRHRHPVRLVPCTASARPWQSRAEVHAR